MLYTGKSVLKSVQNTQRQTGIMYNIWMLHLVVRKETASLWTVNGF